tara:strand:- start:9182 stop:10636 length:1455 start_codon:yes stop_codon:yes gene_type:complete
MKYKKVLLIAPFYQKTRFVVPVLPVGLGYIAEFLQGHNVECRIIDLAFGNRLDLLKQETESFSPDIIGFSMMSFEYKDVYGVIRNIKKSFSQIKIVVGGPHISSCQADVLKECREIDFGVIGEGEETMLELAKGIEPSSIPGVVFRSNGEIKSNGLRNASDNLDKFPFPRYVGFDLEKYNYGVSIVSSRGCPFRCIYCTAHIIRKKIRGRSAGHVVDEIEYWYRKGYREFSFQEDNLAFDKDRLLKMCDEIERRGLNDAKMMCGNGVRADCVNRDILKRMKDAGFKRLGFGVESGNEQVLKKIKKGEKLEVIKQAVKDACELDFFVSLFFIVGSPGETYEKFMDSIKFALSFPASQVYFYNLVPLPETELFNYVEKNNYFLIKPESYLNSGGNVQDMPLPVFETPEFPAKMRIKAMKKGKETERLVKRNIMKKRLDKLYPFNHIIAVIYTLKIVQAIDTKLMGYELFRRTIGKGRNKFREVFYK